MEQIIRNIELFDEKTQKQLICAVNGFATESVDNLSKWVMNDIETKKPQWFHSSVAVVLLNKYSSLRGNNSWYKLLVDTKAETQVVNVARKLLSDDEDGVSFLECYEKLFSNQVKIIDQKNNTITDHVIQ